MTRTRLIAALLGVAVAAGPVVAQPGAQGPGSGPWTQPGTGPGLGVPSGAVPAPLTDAERAALAKSVAAVRKTAEEVVRIGGQPA